MKKDLPSLPLFTDTFIAETTHLNNEQIGIYIRLLCWSWTKKGRAITHEQANQICQCIDDDCRKEVFKILYEFFIFNKKNNDFTSKRIKQEQDYLNDYYEKKSIAGKKGGLARKDFATSKTEPHIPIPIPIPINKLFNTFWEALTIKRGSKKVAQVRFAKECKELDPLLLAKLYNSYSSKIPDKQFIQHISTWLSQRRFEDEDLKQIGPTLIERMKKLGYKSRGREGDYEQFIKDGKNYRLHKYKEKAEIELEP